MSNTTIRSRTGRALAISAAVALAVAFAACGGDSDAPQEATTTTEAPDTDVAPPDTETTEVGAEIYYAGFRVEVEEARLEADDSDGAMVEVQATVENLRDDDAAFPAEELEIGWDDETSGTRFGGEVVRAGASQRLTLEFGVDETFAFDDAVLVAGTPRQIQASVPLSDPDEAVPAAPIPLEAPAEAGTDPMLEVAITELELLPYDPLGFNAEQAALDEPFLVVTVDVTLHEDPESVTQYDANVLDSSFRLVLPDGTEMGAASGPNEVVSRGMTARDLGVSFTLLDVPFDPDELPEGEYTLVVTPQGVGLDAEVSITFELTLAT